MHRTAITILSVSALVLAAGSAGAERLRPDSPRDSVHLGERLSQAGSTLSEAIATAERHSNGTAIGVRLAMRSAAIGSQFTGGGADDGWLDQRGISRDTQRAPLQDARGPAGQARHDDQDWFVDKAAKRSQPDLTDQERQAEHRLLGGLTEQERQRELGRLAEMTDQQRRAEQRRLASLSDQDRMAQQRAAQKTWADAQSRPTESVAREPAWESGAPASDTPGSLYAIVTCVVDQARVREVVVDMKTNTVLGVLSPAALRPGTEGEAVRHGDANQAARPALVRASDLMNATVRNASGGRIGDIDELAIDPDNNRVVYGVLRRGGFLGMGESRYAIAPNELAGLRDGRIQLNLHDRDFEGHSGFENRNWPTRSDPEWSTSWDTGAPDAPAASRIVKASDVIGRSVQCSNGKSVGKVTDLIVEPRSGRIVYAIVGSGRGAMPVPMSALSAKGDAYGMSVTEPEILAMPTIDADREPDWNDARWNRRIHDSYRVRMDATPVVGVGRDGR